MNNNKHVILYFQVNGSWRLGLGACLFWTGCDVFLSTTSIMHLCAIALHRFLGISYPLHFRSQQGKRHVIALLLPTWTVSFAISVPLVIQGLTNQQHVLIIDEQGKPQCGIFDHTFVVYSSMVSFFIPLVIMVVADIRSVQVLRKSSAVVSTAQPYKNSLRRSKSCKSTMCSSVDASSTYSMIPSRQLTKSRSLWSGDSNFRLSVGDTPPTSHGSMMSHLKDSCCSSDNSFLNKSHVDASSCSSDTVSTQRQPSLIRHNQHYEVMSRQTSSTDNDVHLIRKNTSSPAPKHNRSKFNDSEEQKKKLGYIGMLATRGIQKLNSRERRAERTLIWVFVCFVVLWLPFFCTNLTYGLCVSCKIPPRLFLAFTWLGYISSGVNPCIYTLLNKDFRTAFISILLCRVYRRHGLGRQGTRQRFNME